MMELQLTSYDGVLISGRAAGKDTQAGPDGREGGLVDDPPRAHHKITELLPLQHQGRIRSSRRTVTAAGAATTVHAACMVMQINMASQCGVLCEILGRFALGKNASGPLDKPRLRKSDALVCVAGIQLQNIKQSGRWCLQRRLGLRCTPMLESTSQAQQHQWLWLRLLQLKHNPESAAPPRACLALECNTLHKQTIDPRRPKTFAKNTTECCCYCYGHEAIASTNVPAMGNLRDIRTP